MTWRATALDLVEGARFALHSSVVTMLIAALAIAVGVVPCARLVVALAASIAAAERARDDGGAGTSTIGAYTWDAADHAAVDTPVALAFVGTRVFWTYGSLYGGGI